MVCMLCYSTGVSPADILPLPVLQPLTPSSPLLVPTTSSTPTTKRTPFTPLQQQQPQPASTARSHSSSSASAYERDRARDYIAARQHRLADERSRAHLQRQRQREREREEEEALRLAEAEAEARRAAAVAKEARRRQRLAEQQRHEEQKRRQYQQQQQRALREDRRRLEHTRRAREIANAWNSYETRWGLLSQSQSPNQRQLGGASLTFERIPWPVADSEVVIPPLDGRRTTRTTRRAALDELLRPEAIREFLLSPAHSPEVLSKDRIRTALRRWHPDKFARLLGLVVESDKDAVADGVGIVVRCLNEMLERENHA
jgi:hypothetical protein